MKVPNLERMIHTIELDITYTVCENCLMYLNEHKLISQGVRETNEDYTLILVCPMLTIFGRLRLGKDTQFKSKSMPNDEAVYFAHQNDQYIYE